MPADVPILPVASAQAGEARPPVHDAAGTWHTPAGGGLAGVPCQRGSAAGRGPRSMPPRGSMSAAGIPGKHPARGVLPRTLVSRPQTNHGGAAAAQGGRAARTPRASVADLRDRPLPLAQPHFGHTLRSLPRSSRAHARPSWKHGLLGTRASRPHSCFRGLRPRAGGAPAFPGCAVPRTRPREACLPEIPAAHMPLDGGAVERTAEWAIMAAGEAAANPLVRDAGPRPPMIPGP